MFPEEQSEDGVAARGRRVSEQRPQKRQESRVKPEGLVAEGSCTGSQTRTHARLYRVQRALHVLCCCKDQPSATTCKSAEAGGDEGMKRTCCSESRSLDQFCMLTPRLSTPARSTTRSVAMVSPDASSRTNILQMEWDFLLS